MTLTLIAIAAGLLLLERLYPARELPRVRAWWPRVVLLNLIQLGLVIVAGLTWDTWMQGRSLFGLDAALGPWGQGGVAYLVSCVVYYGWHRVRHESELFWRLCHQLHHSPRRLEVAMAFFKHPVEVSCNALLSSGLVYLLLGCSVEGAAIYTLFAGLAEFFYHLNVRTPHWLGYVIQRPEAHRVHHQRGRHTLNYADLPVIDMVFGTFFNPPADSEVACGFDAEREQRFGAMLSFRDVHADAADTAPGRLPTCIGCRKRWACVDPPARLPLAKRAA